MKAGGTERIVSNAVVDSVPLKQIKAKVEVYDKALLATDPRFRRSVVIIHEDGTILNFQNAFLMKTDDWIVCFTEHFGFHIFHYSDLDSYSEFERRYQALEEIP